MTEETTTTTETERAGLITLANVYEQDFNELHANGAPVEGRFYSPVMVGYAARHGLVKKYAWAVPNTRAILGIAEYGPILEVAAGSGYWTMLLREANVQVHAYDENPYDNDWVDGNHSIVLQMSAVDAIRKHPDMTLMMVWPPYDNDMAYDAIRETNAEHIVYVGESQGGCNANDAFFEYLYERFELVEGLEIPRWEGIHDYLEIWRRK